ncbi:MAG TPA: peptidoglycan binding domain-containing protein, partial [Polyangiaceae bacterium]|nr:peptidoglycan binding domain-containing protein [Polyangiaceae bacterium]
MVQLGVAAGLGVLLGLALIAPRRGTTEDARLQLYGEPLPAAAEAADAAVERAERRWEGWFNLEVPDGPQRRIRCADLGVALDRPRLRRLVRDTSNSGRGDAPTTSLGGAGPIELIVPVLLDRPRATAALIALKDELDQPAHDARLDLDSRAVIPERVGRRLDVDRSLLAIEAALERGAASAPLSFQSEPPERRAHELDGVRHDVLLGFFVTAYDPRARDRAFNL